MTVAPCRFLRRSPTARSCAKVERFCECRNRNMLGEYFAPWRLCARSLAIAIVAVGLAMLPSPACAAEPLRVMTFNIRYGTANDGENSWPKRREMLFDVIREFRPDVFGVQEALAFQVEQLEDALPGYEHFGVGRDDGAQAGEFAAIFYRTERLQFVDGGTFWLSDTPEVVGSTTWGNDLTRICTWAEFRDRAGGEDARFRLYNNHWDHQSQPARERSAALVVKKIAAEAAGLPVLVTGDFNADEDNAAVATILHGDPPLRDTFREVHPDVKNVGTFTGFAPQADGRKIDYVLVTPQWRVQAADIVRTQVDGRHPSDHFPVTAIVELK